MCAVKNHKLWCVIVGDRGGIKGNTSRNWLGGDGTRQIIEPKCQKRGVWEGMRFDIYVAAARALYLKALWTMSRAAKGAGGPAVCVAGGRDCSRKRPERCPKAREGPKVTRRGLGTVGDPHDGGVRIGLQPLTPTSAGIKGEEALGESVWPGVRGRNNTRGSPHGQKVPRGRKPD